MQEQLKKRDLQRLEDMVAYCRTRDCLRAYILRYFGQKCPDRCGNCGSCDTAAMEVDMTEQAEIILKTIQSVENRYDKSFGMKLYTAMLHGRREKAVTAWRLDELPQFGKLRTMAIADIQDLMEQMTLQGLLAEDRDGNFTVITLGPMAPEVLQYGLRVRIRVQ